MRTIWRLASAIGSPVHKILDDQKTSMNLVYQLMAADKEKFFVDGVVHITGSGLYAVDMGINIRPYESYRMTILCHLEDFTFESCAVTGMKICIWINDRTIDFDIDPESASSKSLLRQLQKHRGYSALVRGCDVFNGGAETLLEHMRDKALKEPTTCRVENCNKGCGKQNGSGVKLTLPKPFTGIHNQWATIWYFKLWIRPYVPKRA